MTPHILTTKNDSLYYNQILSKIAEVEYEYRQAIKSGKKPQYTIFPPQSPKEWDCLEYKPNQGWFFNIPLRVYWDLNHPDGHTKYIPLIYCLEMFDIPHKQVFDNIIAIATKHDAYSKDSKIEHLLFIKETPKQIILTEYELNPCNDTVACREQTIDKHRFQLKDIHNDYSEDMRNLFRHFN